jgi:signal transduction histidine kinase
VAAALACLNVIGTIAVATLAYRTSRESLEQQAALSIDVAARAREESLVRMLKGRNDRMTAFLGSLESLCGERGPGGRLSWERECVRVALSGFQTAERATAVELNYRTRPLVVRGTWTARAAPPAPNQLAAIDARSGKGDYEVQTSRGDLAGRAQYPLDDVNAIFRDRSGLEPRGDVFLTDDRGALLTAARDPNATGMIRRSRAVSAIGGGRIVAGVPYADVLVPIQQLGRRVVVASIVFVFIGTVVALMLAHAATRPLARLAKSADEARLEAEDANRTKDDFLAMLSHELRTPLTAILGWSSIMRSRGGGHPLALEGLGAIERSARTQARLVDELLDVSRIVSGKLRLIPAGNVSPVRVVEAAVEAIRPAAEAKRLEIVTSIETTPRAITADAGRLQQVISNLLSNAVRFTPDGGRVEVSVAADSDGVELRVADSGIGITKEFLPHVFERFRQADSTTTRAYGGLGLGLAIARHLVELHGGTIRAESAGAGCGATFVVRLPRVPAAGATTHVEPIRKRSVPPLLEGTRIVVVDDDPETRSVVRAILEEAGAVVATTASAHQTRALLRHAEPDVLIADIGMPSEDGYALMRSVRALPSSKAAAVPAIALSAHVRQEDVDEALAAGFQMHLSKPIEPSKLLSAVTSTLLHNWTN